MFTLVDTSALLSQEVLCPPLPQVWLRTSQSLSRDLQQVFCSPPALGTHQSHQTSSLCGLVNIRWALCLFVVVALILLVWLILSSQGSTYWQWPVGLVRPQRVFKHVESTRVEWPWHIWSTGCVKHFPSIPIPVTPCPPLELRFTCSGFAFILSGPLYPIALNVIRPLIWPD